MSIRKTRTYQCPWCGGCAVGKSWRVRRIECPLCGIRMRVVIKPKPHCCETHECGMTSTTAGPALGSQHCTCHAQLFAGCRRR